MRIAFTAASPNIPAMTKAALPQTAVRQGGRAAALDRHHRPALSRPHRRCASITSIFRWPGPGSFPQFMVSQLAARHLKVVLGGQGGDEIFGGYARYLLAYFEQCIKAALDGTYKNGNFVVTIEFDRAQSRSAARIQADDDASSGGRACSVTSTSVISAWSTARPTWPSEVDWAVLDKSRVFDSFRAIFNNQSNVQQGSLFRQDDAFRFQMPAAGAAAGRRPHEHGAWAREPGAVARPSADRIPRHCAGRREIRGRPDEAPAEARLWR